MFKNKSSSSFFHKIIDYAGFFPPSQLPIEEAFNNFLYYQKQGHREMLSKFICPAHHLQTIYDLCIEKDTSNIPVIVVGPAKDIENQMHWMSMHNDRLSFSVAEIKFDYREDSLLNISRIINSDISLDIVFLEPDCESIDTSFVSFLDELSNNSSFGLKIRCGGSMAKVVPPANLLSSLFILCAERTIPLKFTAGLHHAVRYINDDNHIEHGFINVFLGSVAAYSGITEKAVISNMLECQNKHKFIFSDYGIEFEGSKISHTDITKARQSITSFGSCDFIQPVDDLKDMEIIIS